MDKQVHINNTVLSFALFILVSVLSCPCSYIGSLYFTENTAWFGVIVAFAPFLVSSLLILFFVYPHSHNIKSSTRVRNTILILTVISICVVAWFSLRSRNQADIDTLYSLILALATWCSGFLGGLTVITLRFQA